MKKKGLVIQSAIMLAVAFIMLTTASFAWFANEFTSVGNFNVEIAGNTKVEVTFFNKSDGEYKAAAASESFIFFNELMYPGKMVELRLRVKNLGTSGNLNISFFDAEYHLQVNPEDNPESSLEHLNEMLHIFVSYGYDGEEKGVEEQVNIMEQLGIPVQSDTKIKVISGVPLNENQIIEIDYRFFLSPNTSNLDGLFSLTCKGIRFLVN